MNTTSPPMSPSSGGQRLLPANQIDARWRPGAVRRFPFASFAALLAALCAAAAMGAVVILSDGSPVSSWGISPAVYLAVASAVANILLRYSFSENLQITWWVTALKGDTTLAKLHHIWAFGESLKDSLLAGRSFNMVALASILLSVLPADSPLAQRSSKVSVKSVSGPVNADIQALAQLPSGATGIIGGRGHLVGFTTLDFGRVVQDYTAQRPIPIQSSPCRGTCSGTLQAAGYDIHCSESQVSFQVTSQATDSVDVFKTEFLYNEVDDPSPSFNLSTLVKSRAGCNGTLDKKLCTLTPAVLDYHVLIVNQTVSLDPSFPYSTDQVIRYTPAESMQTVGPSDHGGIYLAANTMFQSSVALRFAGAVGFELTASGITAIQYAASDGTGSATDQLYGNFDCPIYWTDPTDDLLDATRQLMFRTALTMANSSTTVQLTNAVDSWSEPVYESVYIFLAVSLLLIVLAFLAVIPMSWGWWQLGRDVSLSPIETAKAFDAPILSDAGSNVPAKGLLKDYGQRQATYGMVRFGYLNGTVMDRLVISGPGVSQEPVKNWIYA
ncbi:hypothetical protein QBC47DRAFT_393573 [Echria macrotheca]|uniref:Uncharacterized protein n=1 Tax=Echria macrotheca TaxID=438768 RepID=A0AAJ0B3F9_9PEZI|nr:hypothetical protein QBC47DRAFT_393573 [Echria macrotheca]